MATNDYHFITHWHVEGTLQEVNEILGDATGLTRWWPAVYMDVKELEPGDKNGVGKKIDLYTKGWLPYTLRWQFVVTESNPPYGSTLVAKGDFDGRGVWKFEQDGQYVNITYDWKISAEKGLLKNLSFIMKPIFEQNHLWAMKMGEQSLKLELARRHAKTEEERARIPAPPPPTTTSPVPLLLGTGGLIAVLGGAIYWLIRLIAR